MGGGAQRKCVRCMQWLCCVLVVGKVWRIVPCVYKIYTLDRFQFHGLLVSFSSPTHAHTYPYTRTLPRAYAAHIYYCSAFTKNLFLWCLKYSPFISVISYCYCYKAVSTLCVFLCFL